MTPVQTASHPEVVSEQVPRAQKGWITLVTSAEHKAVGRMYIATSLVFAAAALAEFLMMRLQLMIPENTLIRPEIFDRLLSAFGVTSVILFALPLLIGLMSVVVPLQIGARGMALPRLHHLSYWLYVSGGALIYGSFLYRPSEAGILALPPLSSSQFLPGAAVDAWLTGFALALLGFIFFAVSMIATLRNLRAPGMALQRMPLFSWAAGIVSYTQLVLAPVFLGAIAMLIIDRHYGGVFFDSGESGKPMLFEHLAFIFISGAVVSLLVGAMAAISEILSTFSRQPHFGHRTMAGSLVVLAVLAVLAWMQNMYSGPIPDGFLYFAMLMALAAIVPIGLILFNWIGTMTGGAKRRGMPFKFALGAIVLTLIGLAGKLVTAVVPVGGLLAGSAFTTGTSFALIAGTGVMGGFAALYYWFPKLSGRLMGDALGVTSYWLLITGAVVYALTTMMAGLEGMPVDVAKFYGDSGLDVLNLLASIAAIAFVAGFMLTMLNAAASYRNGVEVGPDPWLGNTLEWFAPSPPPVHNFDLVPDVRSAEPLDDIRDAIRRRATRWYPPAARTEEREPEPVAVTAGGAEPAAEGDAGPEPAPEDSYRGENDSR
ncbi:MAG: cbb3-type cytochrome c oxidase subunit I [Solirubrobacterales bacterium]|nr:cbb3-type cytochrome c oxidase subunit I [Solirubrobacterales bacterium]